MSASQETAVRIVLDNLYKLLGFCSLAFRGRSPKLHKATLAQPGKSHFCSAAAGAAFKPGALIPTSLAAARAVSALPSAALSQAKPDKAQKTKGLGAARKSSGFVCSSCPRPRRQPRGQIWACQEIHAQSLVNFGWDSGLGFSKGHMGGARDFVPEAPVVPGEVSGQVPPFSLPSPWVLSGLYLVASNG